MTNSTFRLVAQMLDRFCQCVSSSEAHSIVTEIAEAVIEL